jgi:hypothetical protein
MTIEWSQFERNSSGEFPDRWKPENEGDRISGTVKSIRIATMPDGNRYPSITIVSNGVEREVLASQVQLLRLLAEKKPQAGDTLTIVHTRVEKLQGGKTMKHFTVEVVKGSRPSADDLV